MQARFSADFANLDCPPLHGDADGLMVDGDDRSWLACHVTEATHWVLATPE